MPSFKRPMIRSRSHSSASELPLAASHGNEHFARTLQQRARQQGVTLLELLVGIVIGLMTIAVAMGALIASRGVSSSVSDISQLQQQASYAFRVIGSQLRQAGSLRLNLAPAKNEGDPIDSIDPVAFETAVDGFNPATDSIFGINAPSADEYKLTVGYRNYTEQLFNKSASESMLRNCLGQTGSDARVRSQFRFDADTRELRCAGEDEAKPLVKNVANFSVRYLHQTDPSPFGNPQIKYVNASALDATQWGQVTAVEVCIVMFGSDTTNMPAGTTYSDCPADDGTITKIDMTQLAAPRKNRVHMVFRNVFQLRSQGLLG